LAEDADAIVENVLTRCVQNRAGEVHCGEPSSLRPEVPVPLCPLPTTPIELAPYGGGHVAKVRARALERSARGVSEKASKWLPKADVDELVRLASDRATFVGPDVRCFEPRHEFVLYDTANHEVARLSLCFECRKLVGDPVPVAAIVGPGASPESLSDEALERLRGICERAGFPYCRTP
jgi:hypothetical protein